MPRRQGDGLGWLWMPALAAFVLHAAFAWRYGFHRDEFYYLVGGRHLQWGYVDHPPVTPFVARAVELVAGTSFVALRFVAAVACAGVVAFTGLIARELGAHRRGVALAGFAALATPLLVGSGALFSTTTFDQLFWALCTWCAVRLVVRRDPRLWPALGAAIGLAGLNKYTIAAFVIGLVVGLLVTPERRLLWTPWLLVAAAAAAVMMLPNVLWQANHGMAVVEFTANMSSRDSDRLRFLVEQIVFLGPVGVVLAVPGVRMLWRERGLRCLLWLAAVVYVFLAVSGAKGYYAGGIFPLLLAAGSAALVRSGDGAPRRAWWWAFGVQLAVAVVLGLPVLPLTAVHSLGLEGFRTEWGDMVGWEELVDTVADVRDALPADERGSVQIFASNYGDAGAIEILGPRRNLPPAISGHNTYTFWGPPEETSQTVITVGFPMRIVESFFDRCEQAATLTNPYGIRNETAGTAVLVCRNPKGTWAETWPQLRHYS